MMENKRRQLEALKKIELNKKAIRGLTQKAARKRAMEVKNLESIQKEIMKNKSAAVKGKKKNADKSFDNEKSKDSEKELQVSNGTHYRQVSTNISLRSKIIAPLQGKRKVPEATDTHGCSHYGVRDLKALPKDYLESYVKVGGWLHKKPCKDCATREENGREKVLDVSTLLNLKGNRDAVGYYCNSGPTGHTMGEEEEWRHQWTCDMVLCRECYGDRLETSGDSKRNRRNQISL
jgi:hypothetical protein